MDIFDPSFRVNLIDWPDPGLFRVFKATRNRGSGFKGPWFPLIYCKDYPPFRVNPSGFRCETGKRIRGHSTPSFLFDGPHSLFLYLYLLTQGTSGRIRRALPLVDTCPHWNVNTITIIRSRENPGYLPVVFYRTFFLTVWRSNPIIYHLKFSRAEYALNASWGVLSWRSSIGRATDL